MPKITVEIDYDCPDDPYWLNPDNVKYCLEKTCSNTHFAVHWAEGGGPWKRYPMSNRQGRFLRPEEDNYEKRKNEYKRNKRVQAII